jgi:hypothetical protein
MPKPYAERPHISHWRQLGSTVAVIFVVAVLANYLWELTQAPLYVGTGSLRTVLWHCFVASLGDGLLVLSIFVIGWVTLRRYTWFVHPGVAGYGVMVAAGLVIGIIIEWVAVHLLGAGCIPAVCRSCLDSTWESSPSCRCLYFRR